jgi:hypothetical protein
VAFSPGLDRLVSASGDGCIFVWQLPADVSRSMRSRQSELQTCESVVSTPRERVSGAGVFAASPSPKKPVKGKKAAKPTISDLRKISVDADVSAESSRAKRDEHVIASQRSMLSALLDETLLPKQTPEASLATTGGTAGDEAAQGQGQEGPKASSPVPVVQRGNWMSAAGAEADGLPPLKRALAQPQPVPGGRGGAGGRGQNGRGGNNEGDLVVSELDSRDVVRQNVGQADSVVDSAVASTDASTVATAMEADLDDDRPGHDDVVHEEGPVEDDKVLDFTVLTSEDVRLSRALDASSSVLNASSGVRPGNVSGLGELESDVDDELQGRFPQSALHSFIVRDALLVAVCITDCPEIPSDGGAVEVDESTTRRVSPSECMQEEADQVRVFLSVRLHVTCFCVFLSLSLSLSFCLCVSCCLSLHLLASWFFLSTAATHAPLHARTPATGR